MPTEYREVRIALPPMRFRMDGTLELCHLPAGARVLSLPSIADVMEVIRNGGTLSLSYEIDVEPPMTISYEIEGSGFSD